MRSKSFVLSVSTNQDWWDEIQDYVAFSTHSLLMLYLCCFCCHCCRRCQCCHCCYLCSSLKASIYFEAASWKVNNLYTHFRQNFCECDFVRSRNTDCIALLVISSAFCIYVSVLRYKTCDSLWYDSILILWCYCFSINASFTICFLEDVRFSSSLLIRHTKIKTMICQAFEMLSFFTT